MHGGSIAPLTVGMRGCCPRCGEGRLFDGFLRLRDKCDNCDLDFEFADSGDGPAVFVILIVGFVLVAAALIVEVAYQPPYWIHAAIWLPLTLCLALGVLRPLKAMMVAQQYRTKAREGRMAGD